MIAILAAAVVFGFVAFLAIRNPLLARLAGREATRRRGQSLLVIGGLMIGSAAITASLIGADSSRDSFTDGAYRSYGNIDLTVSAGSTFFPATVADRLANDPELAKVSDGVTGAIQVVGSVADLTRRQGEPAVTVVGFDPSRQAPFGRFELADGRTTLGDDLGDGGVLLSRALAANLHAHVGDSLQVHAEQGPGGGVPPALRVAGVAKAEGPGAFGLRPAVFAPLPLAERIVGTSGINVVWISANGDVRGGVEGGRRAVPVANRVLTAVHADVPLRVREAKRRAVDSAQTATQFVGALLLGMSFLIVAAGAALVVNLILMLAEERRPRLGVLRALGMTRKQLVQMSVIEGAIYSLGAAVVGTAIGVAAGGLIASRFAKAFTQFFSSTGDATDFRFVFSVRPLTLATALATGALITLVTVWRAARRTSRMSIPAAIRDLPEPARERRKTWVRVLLVGAVAVAGAVALVASVAGGILPLRLIGGALLIVALAVVLKPRLSSRAHPTLIGAALTMWAFFVSAGLSDPSIDPTEFFLTFIPAVLMSVFGLSILLAANLRLVERGASLLGRASGAATRSVRVPLAYLSRRPLRTGLTTGMFAIVMTILSLMAVFLFAFRPQYERDSKGFEIRATSTGSATVAIPADVANQLDREVHIPTLGYLGPVAARDFSSESLFLPLYQLNPADATEQPVRITSKEKRFADDDDVWAAVLSNPRYVVSDFYNAGSKFTLTSATGPVTFEVVAQQQFGIVDGVLGSPAAFRAFGTLPRGTTLLLDTKDGVDAEAVAAKLEARLFADGVDPQTTKSLLDAGYRANRTFFSVIEILMQMGLVVGVLSLGILALRAVVERRHAIGVLRAIGYRKRGVMGGLLAEAGVTASMGVVVGVVTGAVMGYLFVREQSGTTGFGLDGATLGGALALMYGAVLLVTLGPAWRASRLPPAEAVRYSE